MLANASVYKLYYDVEKNKLNNNNNIKSKENIIQMHYAFRIKVIHIIALLLTASIIFRLAYINTYNTNFLNKQLQSRIDRTIKVENMRGTVTDRNGNPLAVSTPVSSIWVDPSQLDNLSNSNIQQLAKLLNMPVSGLNNKLNQKDKTFVYIKREISPALATQILDMHINGIYSVPEFKRYYPYGEVTAQVVGFDNIDDIGINGIEYASNKLLTGIDGQYSIIRDRQGHVVEQVGMDHPAQNGATITLALDTRIQYIAYNALKQQVDKLHAKSGAVVVLNAKTGEILAMVNMPTYNPNNRNGATAEMLNNRAITNVYDPGSIIKPLVVAKALNDKLVTPQTIFNTHPYYVGPKLIKDDEPAPQLSVANILIRSSDIGTSKIALKYKPYPLWQYYRAIGFGETTHTNFPGETNGILLNWKKWHPIDQALMAYGYGISVSLLQMARAYSVFTNNGCILPVTFYKQQNNVKCNQVISSATATTVRNILAENTVTGTGKNAQLKDYTTAGKTGTAQKLVDGHYSNREHMGSFVGFAPATDPKLIIAITINTTHGIYYGAAVAAPLFSQIAGPALHLLNVKPDR